jgi:hypothetical protein
MIEQMNPSRVRQSPSSQLIPLVSRCLVDVRRSDDGPGHFGARPPSVAPDSLATSCAQAAERFAASFNSLTCGTSKDCSRSEATDGARPRRGQTPPGSEAASSTLRSTSSKASINSSRCTSKCQAGCSWRLAQGTSRLLQPLIGTCWDSTPMINTGSGA